MNRCFAPAHLVPLRALLSRALLAVLAFSLPGCGGAPGNEWRSQGLGGQNASRVIAPVVKSGP